MNTPQDLLDQIHSSGILQLNLTEISTKTARLEQIKLARQKLRLIKKQLQDARSIVKAKWDGRNQYEKVQENDELQPYQKIEDVILRIEIALSEMEINHNATMPIYGKRIYGNSSFKFWDIGSENDAQIWELEFGRRLVRLQLSEKKREIDDLIQESKQTIDLLLVNNRNLEQGLKSKGKLFMGIFFLILMVFFGLVVISLIPNLRLELQEMMLIALVFASVPIAGIAMIYSWLTERPKIRREITDNHADILELRNDIDSLKRDFRSLAQKAKDADDAMVQEISRIKALAND